MIHKKNLYMYFVALVASLGGFQFGYEVGILESIKNFIAFKMDFTDLYEKKLVPVNDKMYKLVFVEKVNISSTLVMSMFSMGCVIGTFIVPKTCDFFGRKRSILFGAGFFGFGSLFAGVIDGLPLFYISRVIMGIGVGILSTVCPMYIAETAPTENRGKLITLYQLMITIGIFTAYIVRYFIRKWLQFDVNVQWRVILGIQVIPGFMLLIMMFFLPYSPRYYIWQERPSDALRIVSKLRGMSSTRDPEIQTEFQNMRKSLEVEKGDSSEGYNELFKRPMLKRLLIVMGLQALQQLTGINVVLNYSSDKFKNLLHYSLHSGDPQHTNFFINLLNRITRNPETSISYLNVCVNVIGTLPTFWMIDKMGRKPVLIIGSLSMTISLAASAVFNYIENNYTNSKTATILSVVCIFIFVLSFAGSWGPAVWVYQSEVFPMRVRSKATSLCSFANWLLFALIDTFYPVIFKKLKDIKKTYLSNIFFAICCFISFFYVLFFIRETKGIPLEEIDSVLENKENTKQK